MDEDYTWNSDSKLSNTSNLKTVKLFLLTPNLFNPHIKAIFGCRWSYQWKQLRWRQIPTQQHRTLWLIRTLLLQKKLFKQNKNDHSLNHENIREFQMKVNSFLFHILFRFSITGVHKESTILVEILTPNLQISPVNQAVSLENNPLQITVEISAETTTVFYR